MTEVKYSIRIEAGPERVFAMVVNRERFAEWTEPFGANIDVRGEWRTGARIEFRTPELGGTAVVVEEARAPDLIRYRHVALLGPDGAEDATSEAAVKWIGTVETYSLREDGGATEFAVSCRTHPDFAPMFDAGWPKALELLKAICERD